METTYDPEAGVQGGIFESFFCKQLNKIIKKGVFKNFKIKRYPNGKYKEDISLSDNKNNIICYFETERRLSNWIDGKFPDRWKDLCVLYRRTKNKKNLSKTFFIVSNNMTHGLIFSSKSLKPERISKKPKLTKRGLENFYSVPLAECLEINFEDTIESQCKVLYNVIFGKFKKDFIKMKKTSSAKQIKRINFDKAINLLEEYGPLFVKWAYLSEEILMDKELNKRAAGVSSMGNKSNLIPLDYSSTKELFEELFKQYLDKYPSQSQDIINKVEDILSKYTKIKNFSPITVADELISIFTYHIGFEKRLNFRTIRENSGVICSPDINFTTCLIPVKFLRNLVRKSKNSNINDSLKIFNDKIISVKNMVHMTYKKPEAKKEPVVEKINALKDSKTPIICNALDKIRNFLKDIEDICIKYKIKKENVCGCIKSSQEIEEKSKNCFFN